MWRPALIKLYNGTNTYYLSDHNREPVQEGRERIENTQRMANGTMRKYVVADKKTWTVSWSMLPSLSSQTIDGYLGAMSLRSFYESNYDNSLTLSFYSGTTSVVTQPKGTLPSPTYTATVFISDFSATIKKRLGDVDYWDCTISFVEV